MSHNNLQSERGVSLYITFMVMTILLGVSLGMSTLLLNQIASMRSLGYSVFALGAAEAGIDAALYADEKNCTDAEDRVVCLQQAVPQGVQTLPNQATYEVSVEVPGNSCSGSVYCVKARGAFQEIQRAVRVAR